MHIQETQMKEIQEIFNIELIEDSLEKVDSFSPKEKAILQFIVENPDEQYIQLQNTFQVSDSVVLRLARDYGASSKDDIDRIDEAYEDLCD